MWQQFTERASKAIFEAEEQARWHHDALICTEHLLLAVLKDEESTAVKLLNAIEVKPLDVKLELAKRMSFKRKIKGDQGMLFLSPRAKSAISLAYDIARQRNEVGIGTQHLLLGLIREHDGMAGTLLADLGVRYMDAFKGLEKVPATPPTTIHLPHHGWGAVCEAIVPPNPFYLYRVSFYSTRQRRGRFGEVQEINKSDPLGTIFLEDVTSAYLWYQYLRGLGSRALRGFPHRLSISAPLKERFSQLVRKAN